MRLAMPLLFLLATPALADEAAHTGIPGHRSMPELSDIALFACAVLAIWFVRRRLRARFRRTPKD